MKHKFIFIAGPCVMEDRAKTLETAAYLADVAAAFPIEFVFKASFDKANRTSLGSFRGPGLKEGLKILEEVKHRFGLPVLTDVHCLAQVKAVARVADVIQIPAFLCRQTDLVLAVARTKKTVNIKKGQFLAPWDMRHIVKKVESAGNKNIWISERGASFGYNNLVVDFRAFPIMQAFGYPVIYDVTHSMQRPSGAGSISGGDSRFVPTLALAAVAAGVDGLFMEVHPDPKKALSDKHTSFRLDKVKGLLEKIFKVRAAIG